MKRSVKRRSRASAGRALPMALLGGPCSGKSALFQAMVYRVTARRRAGALSPLIGPGPARVRRLETGGRVGADETDRIAGAFERWQSLEDSRSLPADRYRLELPYRTGWLGRATTRLELDLCHRTPLEPAEAEALRQARALVFVVPFWACLPRPDLDPEHRQRAEKHLEALGRQVDEVVRARGANATRASTMLLLTMADDTRCGQTDLLEAWIHRAVEGHRRLLDRLRRERHLLAYLDNARRVSDHLHRALAGAPPASSRVLDLLEFDRSEKAWLLPVSAFDGRVAAHVAAGGESPAEPPVPAHVELPLVLALCEHAGALL